MPTKFTTIQQAIKDLGQGRFVIVLDDTKRENEADLVLSAQAATKEKIAFMLRYASGVICVPMLQAKTETLNLPLMVKDNTEKFSTAFTVTVDAKSLAGSGISAADRAQTIKKLGRKNSRPSDFVRPGHVFPLLAHPGGVLGRAGHTEAITDLLRLAKLEPVGVISELMTDQGEMMRGKKLLAWAQRQKLTVITTRQIKNYRVRTEQLLTREATTVLPTVFGQFKLWLFSNKIDQQLTPVLIKGRVNHQGQVLTRVHSACLTGEIFGSQRCDCQQQLAESLKQINDHGSGILIYLQQEGRGIGLRDKIKAYKLQDQGLDTVEANLRLGHQADERDYWLAAQVLQTLKIKSLILLSNSPDKVNQLSNYGIKIIRRRPLAIAPNRFSQPYLLTKKLKLGHDI